MRTLTLRLGLAALGAALLAVPLAGAAPGSFVEPATILHTFEGENPGAYFGWAISELGDVDGDGAMEAIVGEPFSANGATWVFSGGSGDLLYRLDGQPGDQQGYAIADAGDTNGDGVADVVSGAPGVGAGRAYLYSGATGGLLHTFVGVHAGDNFGAAVASAGDVDRDGRADVLVGAPDSKAGGKGSGRAYIFSGRTYELLRKLDAGHHGDQFGTATDWTADVNGDNVPDQIVGALDAGPERRGRAYVFSGTNGRVLHTIEASPTGEDLGWFFVAGPGDVNGDGVPDVYAADFDDDALGPDTGGAAVYSGADGSELLSFVGSSAGEGLGPGREAGDVDADGHVDLAIGSWTSSDGAAQGGQIEIYSGADGSLMRRLTSTNAGQNFGFDAVGLGDVNGDGVPDLLASAATGDVVYVIAGETP